jgi:long-chain acyl-CoA synthetase
MGQTGTAVEELLQWVNQRVGKTQRVTALQILDELPRSAIGKVLKRELREQYRAKITKNRQSRGSQGS